MSADSILKSVNELLQSEGAQASTVQQLESLVQSMAFYGHQRDDPMREVFARLGDKWSMLLLLILRTGAFRHSMLRRLVSTIGAEGRISQRMLTLRLRTLERDGLIERRTTDTQPPGIEYDLTDLGRDLLGQIELMMGWIQGHNEQIRMARERFEREEPQRVAAHKP